MLYLGAQHQNQSILFNKFSCVNYLSGELFDMVEIIRRDLVNHQWFIISKDLKQVKSLKVNFIDSSTEVEERYFEEGFLKFDAYKGTFIEKFNSAQHQFSHISPYLLPKSISDVIENI